VPVSNVIIIFRLSFLAYKHQQKIRENRKQRTEMRFRLLKPLSGFLFVGCDLENRKLCFLEQKKKSEMEKQGELMSRGILTYFWCFVLCKCT
jgi:hypothetical protein